MYRTIKLHRGVLCAVLGAAAPVAFCIALAVTLFFAGPLAAQDMIEPTGPVELIRSGFEFTEGPAYDPAGVLYFSDIPANKIYAMDSDGEFSVFTDESAHTNGIAYVTGGKYAHKLIACQMDGALALYHSSTGRAEILADSFEGKRFNAPNDLVVDEHDGVYFTDPFFRAPQPLPQEIQAVYYRAGDGTVSRITGHLAAPNGVGLSPDNKRLYVIPTQQAEMLVYEISGPGKIGEPEVFCTLRQPEGKSGTGGDGMAVDEEGNLYITSNLGVQIFSPGGEYRGLVETPEQPANVTFGGPDRKTLYITARTGLYRAPMPIAGQKPN
jgi:gluconolactonase